MYKNKYLKYKQKYLELKKKINVNQKGGMVLYSILMKYDQDRFEGLYRMKTKPLPDGENKNSFQIYLDLLESLPEQERNNIEPYNILVGAGCVSDGDYFRFKDSPTYSLYIDNYDNNEIKEQPERQYNMYTLSYANIKDNLEMMKPNSINQIHFDTGVSYFAPIKYLELAEHVLIRRGKIIWDLLQHGGSLIFRRNNKFKKLDGRDYSNEEITKLLNDYKVTADIEGKKMSPLNDDFFTTNTICPQIRLNIVEFNPNGTTTKYKLEPYNGFIEYCANRFPRLIFEKKTYTFANYTYPVPIRISEDVEDKNNIMINVYNTVVNFVVNVVMNLEERMNYIHNKKVSTEKIIQLCNRINLSDDLKNNILENNIIPTEILNLCKISENPNKYDLSLILEEFIWNEFNIQLEYIEATKV